MKRLSTHFPLLIFAVLCFCCSNFARAGDPVVDYVQISQRPGTKLVDIEYKVTDQDGDEMTISVSGYDYANDQVVPVNTLSGAGADGATVTSGVHHLVWDAGADWPGKLSEDFRITIRASDSAAAEGDYLVIDVSEGPDAAGYPVSYLPAVPAGGWTDEYKTTKIVLRRISAGTFTMGSPDGELGRWSNETQHEVTLTRDFYIGLFEVTQKQWERVMGNWPSYFDNTDYRDARPVESVSYNDIRGSSAGAGWPADNNVDATSFMGRLRQKTDLVLDLPTEAQWEYACRAGTATALNSGKNLTATGSCPNMDEVGRYWYNGGSGYSQSGSTDGGTAKVCSYLPNDWGLHDMHGNVWEWCLDGWQENHSSAAVTDPAGPVSGSYRVERGGGWHILAYGCRSAHRNWYYPSDRILDGGFRLVRNVQ